MVPQLHLQLHPELKFLTQTLTCNSILNSNFQLHLQSEPSTPSLNCIFTSILNFIFNSNFQLHLQLKLSILSSNPNLQLHPQLHLQLKPSTSWFLNFTFNYILNSNS